MTDDEDLIRRLSLWATGATIHRANGLIGWLRACVACVEDGINTEDSARTAARVRRIINDFMRHGDYEKANRDNPVEPTQ